MSISDFANQSDNKETSWNTGTDQTASASTADSTEQSESTTPTQQSPSTLQTSPTSPNPSPTEVSEPPKVDEVLNAIMGNISEIGQKASFKLMIYGDPGTTKSSMIATAPNNLIVDLDEGLISAKTSPYGIADMVRAYPWQGFANFSALIGKLMQSPPELEWIKVLSIDPFSELHKRALAEITEREWAKQPSSNRYVPDTAHHQENNERMLRMIRALRDLDRDIIITAHAKTVEPKDKVAKTYPDFSESLANKIEGMMDVVGYMKKKVVDGRVVPVLQVIADESVHAKTRVPLPAEIINPTYPMIREAWDKLREK